ESFGLAALEAISSGVPVIGTDSGGIPEVIQNGETGYLLPVGDLDGMATAALRILDDDDLRIRLCENGRRVAAEKFSESETVSEYESFYREILAG
ncbi:MAG: glycosyltransferase, partial [Planctomycetota bacterium]|nr:glycosyltransferase [Planctomycetota bacterium]